MKQCGARLITEDSIISIRLSTSIFGLLMLEHEAKHNLLYSLDCASCRATFLSGLPAVKSYVTGFNED